MPAGQKPTLLAQGKPRTMGGARDLRASRGGSRCRRGDTGLGGRPCLQDHPRCVPQNGTALSRRTACHCTLMPLMAIVTNARVHAKAAPVIPRRVRGQSHAIGT